MTIQQSGSALSQRSRPWSLLLSLILQSVPLCSQEQRNKTPKPRSCHIPQEEMKETIEKPSLPTLVILGGNYNSLSSSRFTSNAFDSSRQGISRKSTCHTLTLRQQPAQVIIRVIIALKMESSIGWLSLLWAVRMMQSSSIRSEKLAFSEF